MSIKKLQIQALRRLPKPFDWVEAPPTPPEALLGGRAYERGVPYNQNPYQPGTLAWENWAWAWQESQYCDQWNFMRMPD